MYEKNGRNYGHLKWPQEGTFLSACCDEVVANIKHRKFCDTSSSRPERERREREVLRWFRQEGRRQLLGESTQLPIREVKKEQRKETLKQSEAGTAQTKQPTASKQRMYDQQSAGRGKATGVGQSAQGLLMPHSTPKLAGTVSHNNQMMMKNW